jgi:hypothetical protein
MWKLYSLLEQDDGQTMTEYATTLRHPALLPRSLRPARGREHRRAHAGRRLPHLIGGILGAAEITDIA